MTESVPNAEEQTLLTDEEIVAAWNSKTKAAGEDFLGAYLLHCMRAIAKAQAEKCARPNSEAIGEVVGHKEMGLALVQWADNEHRKIGFRVYAASTPSAIEAPSDVERMLGAALTDALQQDFEGCEELARGVKIEFVGGEPVVRLQSLADFYARKLDSVDRGTDGG